MTLSDEKKFNLEGPNGFALLARYTEGAAVLFEAPTSRTKCYHLDNYRIQWCFKHCCVEWLPELREVLSNPLRILASVCI